MRGGFSLDSKSADEEKTTSGFDGRTLHAR